MCHRLHVANGNLNGGQMLHTIVTWFRLFACWLQYSTLLCCTCRHADLLIQEPNMVTSYSKNGRLSIFSTSFPGAQTRGGQASGPKALVGFHMKSRARADEAAFRGAGCKIEATDDSGSPIVLLADAHFFYPVSFGTRHSYSSAVAVIICYQVEAGMGWSLGLFLHDMWEQVIVVGTTLRSQICKSLLSCAQ